MKKTSSAAILAAAALAVPGSALGAPSASQDTKVSGQVGSELSLNVSDPETMTFTHSSPGRSSAVATVSTTLPNWALTVLDKSSKNPGHMFDPSRGQILSQPLGLTVDGSSGYTLSDSEQTIKKSDRDVDSTALTYDQSLSPDDQVVEGQNFLLVPTYSVFGL